MSQIVSDIFQIIDINRDGTITIEEFSGVLQKLPIDISEDDIDGIVREMDVNGDGDISLHEFAEVLEAHQQ